MTLGDAAEPLVHIKDFRMGFGDTTVIKDLGSIEDGRELSIAGTFRRKELVAK
jgi:hypothetical protein